ncbi:TauD/TfdA family dioxygenase [Paraneptunicella aestuarii]|uniref:TauD/TfdA family dioxygenase n=1 Tax=Paraneptunicella aestuarii TaxID=2831148 RepID=UPI001E2D361B|nr:TauD/TfdA family dioxygenase [Paraneptunicella aestuarii]UAA37415.1 TauD/TfdA family dioxygenase [Paraneptunicella aestuarii]
MTTDTINAIPSDDLTTFVKSLPKGVNYGQSTLPFEVHAINNDLALSEWVKQYREEVNQILYRYGAILFKGFGINDGIRLRDVATAHYDELLGYMERGAPRKELAENVFTSTEYAQEEVIPLHHEMSYSHNWPCTLYFCSQLVAEEGGYTPLADDRKVFAAIPEEIKEKFIAKKVMYVRNYGLGIDMDWEEAFQSSNKKEVEEYLTKSKTSFEWMPGNVLRTKAVRQAIATHPVTGDTVWFNHAHLFHSSNMPSDVREFLVEEFTEEGMPRNAYYGDGTVIEDEVVELIRGLYNQHAVKFDWNEGDALFVDNFLLTHGRSAFKGKRQVCVAMSQLYTNTDL